MKCPKCQGLLLEATFYASHCIDKFEGLKCTACGEIIDPIILQNRKLIPPMILSWTHSPDQISILLNSKRYTYDLPPYWITRVERMWKYSPWKAFNVVKKKGVLRRSYAAHHRPKKKEVLKNAKSCQENAQYTQA